MGHSSAVRTVYVSGPRDDENLNIFSLIWKSSFGSLKKRMVRFRAKVRNGAYPAHIESLWIIIILVAALHFNTQLLPFDLVNVLMSLHPS